MTTIAATVIADSIGTDAPRLTTLQLRYPRFIHAELMTHRVFSRNARSSRAVPVERMISEVVTDPVTPLHWGAAQAGMQASRELKGNARALGEAAWILAAQDAVFRAQEMMNAGAHKQLINRVLEPYLHIDVLVTASEFANFLALRDHAAAEPHMRRLAQAVRAAIDGSVPALLEAGEWHLPYISAADMAELAWQSPSDVRLISAARCARISYRAFDGSAVEANDDLRLARQLVTSGHWSPLEHQARPDAITSGLRCRAQWAEPELHGNFTGWCQHRKLFPSESGVAA